MKVKGRVRGIPSFDGSIVLLVAHSWGCERVVFVRVEASVTQCDRERRPVSTVERGKEEFFFVVFVFPHRHGRMRNLDFWGESFPQRLCKLESTH